MNVPQISIRLIKAIYLTRGSFISSGEQVKRFGSDPGGSVKTPGLASAKETCAHIGQVLKEFYIPKALSCITPTKQTIGDVLDLPDNYAYPAVFIHCAAKLGAEFTNKAQYDNVINSKKTSKISRSMSR